MDFHKKVSSLRVFDFDVCALCTRGIFRLLEQHFHKIYKKHLYRCGLCKFGRSGVRPNLVGFKQR